MLRDAPWIIFLPLTLVDDTSIMRVLAIETSCDETAVAVYDSDTHQVTDVIHSQVKAHAIYGGVVPELAARDHFAKLLGLLCTLSEKVGYDLKTVDGIAYTAGPGLAGALMVGTAFAKSLAYAWDKPALAVNHMEGHLLAPMLLDVPPAAPFIALLVSGGHTQLFQVDRIGEYRLLGESIDDAVGEAFDKTAKLLGLDYPGGPALAALADKGMPIYPLPTPMKHAKNYNFSFSGLKTAARKLIESHNAQDKEIHANIAASFQKAAIETLLYKSLKAVHDTGAASLVVAGGVSANQYLRSELARASEDGRFKVYFPPMHLCTDNAGMIAYAGYTRLKSGQKDASLAIQNTPRWPLSSLQTNTC